MISDKLWYHIKEHAEKLNTRFIQCGSEVYEVRRQHYPTGDSNLWSIELVNATRIPEPESKPTTGDAE